jgi:hypothetical protein
MSIEGKPLSLPARASSIVLGFGVLFQQEGRHQLYVYGYVRVFTDLVPIHQAFKLGLVCS